MELYYLYHIPEPNKRFYFVDIDDEKGAKFTELRSEASIFTRESAISMQTNLKNRYGLDLQMELKQ